MDIEDAERNMLTRNTDWSNRVRVISVEVHGGYTPDQCREDLQALGFESTVVNLWMVHGVTGLRNTTPVSRHKDITC